MISRTPGILLIFALTAISFSMAYASGAPQISLTPIGNSEIDLAWEEKDRMFRVWTEFLNFNSNDASFLMQIIQHETGEVVSESTINVITNSKDSQINFNSFVLYSVNANDICQNKEFDSLTMPSEECAPLTGQYEMKISTNDGQVVKSATFSIINTQA